MNPARQVGAFFDVDDTLLAAPSLELRFIAYLLARDEIGIEQIGRWAAHCAQMIWRNPRAAFDTNKYYLSGLRESLAMDWENSLASDADSPDQAGRTLLSASCLARGERGIWGGRSFSSDIEHPFPSGVLTPETPISTFSANYSVGHSSLPIFAEGLERIAWHSGRGHRIFFVTGTIEPLARPFARILASRGFEYCMEICATQLETHDGLWTGRIVGEHMSGVEKAIALRASAAGHGLALAESYAYGDSFADLPMLETVGHPVAVNPQARLARIARRRGWAVCHWRSLHSDEAATQSDAFASEEAS